MKPVALPLIWLVALAGCASQNVGPIPASVRGSHWERKSYIVEEGVVPRQIAVSAVDGRPVKKPSVDQPVSVPPGDHEIEVVYTREARFTDKLDKTELALGHIKWTAVAGENYVVKGDDYNSASVVKMWIERVTDGSHASDDVDVRKTVENIHWRTNPQLATMSPPSVPLPAPQPITSVETTSIPLRTQQPEAPVEASPIQAILAAAERPEGITGVFKFEVKGTGRQDAWLYLNSEADYRDQRCLTVALTPPTATALESALADDPVVAVKGKTIRVVGTAQRTTVWFYSNGVRTDKFYYQTQIRVRDISQIRILQ